MTSMNVKVLARVCVPIRDGEGKRDYGICVFDHDGEGGKDYASITVSNDDDPSRAFVLSVPMALLDEYVAAKAREILTSMQLAGVLGLNRQGVDSKTADIACEVLSKMVQASPQSAMKLKLKLSSMYGVFGGADKIADDRAAKVAEHNAMRGALERKAASEGKLLMWRGETAEFVDKNCQACAHCFMEPDSDFVCGHPDTGALGAYIRNAADFGGHCGPERLKFKQHPSRWPNGDLK